MIHEMRNKWGIAPNKLSVGFRPICAIGCCVTTPLFVVLFCATLLCVYLLDDHVKGCMLACEVCGRMIDLLILFPVRLCSTTLSSPRVRQDSN
jgi:hypothetical protein